MTSLWMMSQVRTDGSSQLVSLLFHVLFLVANCHMVGGGNLLFFPFIKAFFWFFSGRQKTSVSLSVLRKTMLRLFFSGFSHEFGLLAVNQAINSHKKTTGCAIFNKYFDLHPSMLTNTMVFCHYTCFALLINPKSTSACCLSHLLDHSCSRYIRKRMLNNSSL